MKKLFDFSQTIGEFNTKYVFGIVYLYGGYDDGVLIIGCDDVRELDEYGIDSNPNGYTDWEDGTPPLNEWKVYESHKLCDLDVIATVHRLR